jgi:signal transduction histidine kinase
VLGFTWAVVGVLSEEIKSRKKRIKFLKQANRAKIESVSIATHQLRTPLTVLKWSLKMMLAGDFGKVNAEQKKMLQQNIEANERLIAMVRDLLDISRIEQQRFEIHFKPLSLAKAKQIIQRTVDGLSRQAQKKGLSLNFNTSSLSDNQIFIDQDKIIQALQNLLENAIAYTPSGGRIQVKVEERDNNLLVHISDSGIGIPKAAQKEIFTKFFRATNAKELRSQGTGLGLYLCRTLIEMQDGKIWFSSKQGKGTTFSFSLPLRGRVSAEEFLRRL